MKVLFKNSQGQKREIAEVSDMNEAYQAIYKFCTDRNYEIPYYRGIKRDDEFKIDVGSHTEFFYIVEDELEGDNNEK